MFPNKMSVLPNPRGEPTVAGNTIAPLANYVNNDTSIFSLNGSGGGGGGGVTSLNALSGALSLTSVDNSITIVPSGSTIDLSAVGGGGGVASITAGDGIAVTGTATVPIITATVPAVLIQSNALALPQPPSTGSYPLGATFTVPYDGIYKVMFRMGVNVDGVNGATVGESDNIAVQLTSSVPGHLPVGGYVKPYNMPPSGIGSNGQDYSVTTTVLGGMYAGDTYTATFFISNVSGTMSFPGGASIGYYIAN